jgi:hypothetical protein
MGQTEPHAEGEGTNSLLNIRPRTHVVCLTLAFPYVTLIAAETHHVR